MPTLRPVLLGTFLVCLVPAGCAHQRTTAPSDTAAASPSAGGTKTTPPESVVKRACTADTECGEAKICVNEQCVDVNEAVCGAVRVHFPLDSTELATQDRVGLERAARCLRAQRSLHVTIEGNADERGTDEYNVALGDKRANAVARYLESLGATAAQLQTVSYGKENPVCKEHDEKCWEKNRRAVVTPKAHGG